MNPRPTGIVPLGDGAAYVEFSETLDLALNAALQEVAALIRVEQPGWIRDVVPALGGIALHFDLAHPALPEVPLLAVAELIDRCLAGDRPALAPGRLLEVPVCYEEEFALDLPEIAQRLGLELEEVIRRHGAREYAVLMMGFAPGHPYLGGLDPALAVPRRATPRAAVPAGSVAIANAQSVVYPYQIPGGWNVIGRTPRVLFDAWREPPSLFAPRDRVRFVRIARAEYERLAAEEAQRSAARASVGKAARGSGGGR